MLLKTTLRSWFWLCVDRCIGCEGRGQQAGSMWSQRRELRRRCLSDCDLWHSDSKCPLLENSVHGPADSAIWLYSSTCGETASADPVFPLLFQWAFAHGCLIKVFLILNSPPYQIRFILWLSLFRVPRKVV